MTLAIESLKDGLDVSRPDLTTPDEIAAFRNIYEGTNKGKLDSFQFWVEDRRDVLKRHKARTNHYRGVGARTYHAPGILCQIHHYAISNFKEGVAYEIRLAQSSYGITRADILDTLSALLYSGANALDIADRAAGETSWPR
ncbi:MAG: hypothetical protein LC797_20615 [Chloroflexi bacterium]|nr:hypothetical protein [Chloroflexota bacterium]